MRAIEEKIELTEKKDNIINEIMKSRGLYCLVSEEKVGKTLLSLQLAHSLITGTDFLGHTTIPSSVLYFSTESEFGQIQERLKTLGLKFPKQSLFIIDKYKKSEISIFDFEYELAEFSSKESGRFVIFDMLKDINFGISYNLDNYQDIGQGLLPKIRSLCDKYNLTILFTHHLNKQGNTMGSKAINGTVDGILTLIPNRNDDSIIKLNIRNRDFPQLNIFLKKIDGQIFKIINIENESEVDIDFINFVKYVASSKEIEFTCSDIVTKARLNRTPKAFGIFLKANETLLKNEGVTITNCRSGSQRLYKARYDEVIDED
jgi:RecA-family ATPase